ncbi:MAG: radical SAM protein [Candidatus Ozemobacteraceae bacterium]
MQMRRLAGKVIARNGVQLLVFTPGDSSLLALKVVPDASEPSHPSEQSDSSDCLTRLWHDETALQSVLQAMVPELLQKDSSTSPSHNAECGVSTNKPLPAPLNAAVLSTAWNTFEPHVSALNLNLTEKCNLACVYCYARGGDYQRIHSDMTPETAVKGLEEALRNADPKRLFRIEFFGGEPLLNPSTIQAVLEAQERSSLWRNWPGGTQNRISTNLTVCDDQRVELVRRGKMIVSISLDGTASAQNDQRPFKDGRGSYEIIMDNIRKLRKACPDHVFVARMTAYRHDEHLLEMVSTFASSELFDYVSIYPAAISKAGDANQGDSHFSTPFREAILGVAGEYQRLVKAGGRFKGFLELNRLCADILTGRVALNHCRAGAGYFTLSPDGSVHPCHRLIGDTSWDLKHLNVGTPEIVSRLAPWRTTVDERSGCLACELRYLCGGGCKQQARLSSHDLLGNDKNICAWADLLFEAALTVCANRSPEVDERLGASFAELDRLFVFCGRESIANGRRLALLPEQISVASSAFHTGKISLRPSWVTLEPL